MYTFRSLWMRRSPASARADAAGRLSGLLTGGLTPAGAAGVLLGLWGCLAVFNATAHLVEPFSFAGRQLLWLAVAVVVLLVTSAVPARGYRRLLPWLASGAFALLWLVLLCGVRINGMRGWFAWRGVFLQPSEVAKPVFVLTLAWLFTRGDAGERRGWRGLLLPVAGFALWGIPLALEPDFGALLVYALVFAALAWAAGVPGRVLLTLALLMVAAAVTVLLLFPYVWQRVLGFLFPEAYAQSFGWHVNQFQRAVAAGGVFGCSWGHGMVTQTQLPLGYSDSMFATLAETLGLVGVLPLLLVVVAWVVYGYRRARCAGDAFAGLAILGLVVLLTVQSLIHLSVNLGLMPPTGITLPLISYGGSSLVSSLAAIGMVEGMSRGAR